MAKDQSLIQELVSDLRQFKGILEKNGMVRNSYPLSQAEVKCKISGDDYWHYSVEKLHFHQLGAFRKIIPQSMPHEDIVLEFNLDIYGKYNIESNKDPLIGLSFDIHLSGQCDLEDSDGEIVSKFAECAWHLDKDSPEPNDGPQDFAHPCYHFQFGGHRIKPSTDFGATLILSSPRLAHPPMDAILGIDFILTNFMSSASLEFRQKDRTYRNIVQRSQTRLWKPYINTLAQNWQAGSGRMALWKPSSIWPQLIEL